MRMDNQTLSKLGRLVEAAGSVIGSSPCAVKLWKRHRAAGLQKNRKSGFLQAGSHLPESVAFYLPPRGGSLFCNGIFKILTVFLESTNLVSFRTYSISDRIQDAPQVEQPRLNSGGYRVGYQANIYNRSPAHRLVTMNR